MDALRFFDDLFTLVVVVIVVVVVVMAPDELVVAVVAGVAVTPVTADAALVATTVAVCGVWTCIITICGCWCACTCACVVAMFIPLPLPVRECVIIIGDILGLTLLCLNECCDCECEYAGTPDGNIGGL